MMKLEEIRPASRLLKNFADRTKQDADVDSPDLANQLKTKDYTIDRETDISVLLRDAANDAIDSL